MPGFLDDIEQDIALQARPKRRRQAEQPRKPGSGAIKAAMSRTKGPRPAGLSRRARALGAVDYSVPEPIVVIAQPKSMACWATALTILYSWRDRQSRTIEDVTSEVGAEYRALYDNNSGLSRSKKDDLMRDAGLGNISGTNLTPEGWSDLMRAHGPIWITTSEGAGIHGRILHGIHGDGTAAGTMLDIIDPAGGRQYRESVATFLPKFEREAVTGNTDRVNIVYLESGRAGSMSLRRKARGMGRKVRPARAMSAIDYTVPGIVDLVSQPTGMSCWAASYAMLRNWADNRSASIETNLTALGGPWLGIFQADTGLSGARTSQFIAAAGLLAAPAASFTIDAWADMLRDFGPLLIVTDEAPGKGWAVHARVIYGIRGDGTAAGTVLRIHDPAPVGRGRAFEEKVSDFLPKYEQMAQAAGFLGLQILHFSADAQLSVTRSLRSTEVRRGGVARGLSAAPSAANLANRFGGDIPQRASEIVAGGVSDAAVAEFLARLMPTGTAAAFARRSRALSLVAEGTTVTLPTGHMLEGWKAQLFLDVITGSMSTSFPAAPLLFRGLQELATHAGVTMGIGPAIGGAGAAGDGAGIGLSAGMLIAPGNRIGFYGGLEHSYEGFALGGSITLQFTIVKGGPSSFSGRTVTVGGAAGEGLVGGGRLLLSGDPPSPIGFMVEAGLGSGLSPVEFTGAIQDTVTSLGVRGGVRAFTAADPAVAAAREFGPEAVKVAQGLLREGVASAEIVAFLATLSPDTAPARPMGYVRPFGAPPEDSFEVHLPGATTLTGWQAKLFLAAVTGLATTATVGVGLVPMLAAIGVLSEVTDRLGITIGVGPAISGGVASGVSLGAGMLFAPESKVGYYGSAAIIMGVIASFGASAQLTILNGGPELMDGRAYAIGGNVSLPTGISGAAGLHFLFDAEGNQIGMTFEMGVSALDVLPVEALVQMQYGAETVQTQGLVRATGLSSMWARARPASPRHATAMTGRAKEADYADMGAYKYSPGAAQWTLSRGLGEGDASVPPGASVKNVSFDSLDMVAATETNFKIAEEKIASYINHGVMLFKEGHSQATKDFSVWFRRYIHRKQTSSKSIVEVLGTTLFRVVLDHLIVGPGALAKAIRSMGNKVVSKNLGSALGSGSVDPDAFLAVLARQESLFVDMLSDVAITYRNDDTGNYQEALHTFINDFEKDVDSKYGIPNSVKEILDRDGIPEPNPALRRTVREEVLTRMIEVIYENTIMPNGMNVADNENISSHRLATIEALHEIDPEGNMERICKLESLRNPFFRTYCRGD